MAKRIENECVGCSPEMRCIGDSCPNRNVVRYYCDKCDTEETLYHHDGKELCIDCIIETLDKVGDD